MATKLSLYNDALQLLGERRLATDTEDREPRYDLDSLYDNGAVDYCLELVKPKYASTLVQLTSVAPTAVTEFTNQSPLPADFIAMSEKVDGTPELYRDGRLESPITRFYREDNYLLSDEADPYLRYIKAHTDPQLANMTTSFARVVSSYLARELAWKYDPDSEEQIQTKMEQRVEAARSIQGSNEPDARGFAPDVLTDTLRAIYNDAFQILKLAPINRNDDDSLRKNRISIALDNGLVGSVLEDTSWQFGMTSDQLFYNPSINPTWGYEFVFDLPSNMHKLNGVYMDELMRSPIRDYKQEINQGTGNILLYCSFQIIYIEYVSKDFLTDYDNWPDYFKRLVAARMAIDANIPGGDIQSAFAQYTTRRREAMSTNALNTPPKTLPFGKWSRSRLYRGNISRDRP